MALHGLFHVLVVVDGHKDISICIKEEEKQKEFGSAFTDTQKKPLDPQIPDEKAGT